VGCALIPAKKMGKLSRDAPRGKASYNSQPFWRGNCFAIFVVGINNYDLNGQIRETPRFLSAFSGGLKPLLLRKDEVLENFKK